MTLLGQYTAQIVLSEQCMSIYDAQQHCVFSCAVNTAKHGAGCLKNSECTPLGNHYVRAHIGTGLPAYAVLKGRRFTGEIWTEALAVLHPQRDWILGRILWLCGQESGVNRGGQVDTFHRYIYIHGSPPWQAQTPPSSHGCIRVQPEDMCSVAFWLTYSSSVRILP